MQSSLVSPARNFDYSTKEVGPIILALAFLMIMGGLALTAVAACGGWNHVRSASVNWAHLTAQIVCK